MELLALFVVAAVWRFAYLERLGRTPFAGSLGADSRIYWEWSESILRHGLVPAAPFFLAPLYPYALAGLRAAGAASIPAILAFQAILGSVAVVLVADATGRLAGRPAALAVGCIVALFQATTFFDGLVLPESLLFFVESLLVWFVARADWSRAGIVRYGVYGLLVGVLAQGRASNALLLALVFPLAWARRTQPARRLEALAAAAATFVLCCLPAALANARASRELIPFTYNLGFNLYVGNNPDADGAYVDITGGSIPVPLEGTSPVTGGAFDGRAYVLATEGRRLSPAGSSTYWTAKAARFVRSSPFRALGLAGRKLLLSWNRGHIPQVESMDSFARAAGPLGLPILGSFAFLAILGLSGAVWAARDGPAGRWLVGYLAVVSLSLVPFFVTDRYRHHLVPALVPLAGIAIAGIAQTVGTASLLRSALAVGLAAGIVFAPVGRVRSARLAEWSFTADHAIRLLDRGAYAEAARAFARAESSLSTTPARSYPTSERTNLAAFYFRYAIALEALDRHDEAIARWERAIALNPNDASSLGRLSLAYEQAGRTEDVARARGMLGATPGGRGQLLLNDGWSAAGRGELVAAESLLVGALAAAPNLSMAWDGLIRLRIQTGRIGEAARTLDQARGAGLDLVTAEVYECYLAVRRGDAGTARRALARITTQSAPQDPFLVGLLDQSRRALDERAAPR